MKCNSCGLFSCMHEQKKAIQQTAKATSSDEIFDRYFPPKVATPEDFIVARASMMLDVERSSASERWAANFYDFEMRWLTDRKSFITAIAAKIDNERHIAESQYGRMRERTAAFWAKKITWPTLETHPKEKA